MKLIIYSTALALSMTATLLAQKTLTLSEARALAREHNQSLKSKQIDVDIASEREREAFTNFFPTVSAQGLYFRSSKPLVETSLTLNLSSAIPLPSLPPINVSMIDKGTMAGISLTQPVFAGGRIINGNKLARLGNEVAQLRLRLSERELDEATDKYYWQLLQLEEQEQILLSMEQLLTQLEKDVQTAIKAGLTTENDLLHIRLRQDELRSEHSKLKHGRQTLQLLFAQHLGIAMEAFTLCDDSKPISKPLDLYIDPKVAVQRRLESKLLQSAITAQRLERKVTLGKHLPTLALGGTYSYNDLMGSGKTNAATYLTLSIPISSWWGASHSLRREQLEERQRVIEYDNSTEKMQIQTQRAFMDLEEAYNQTYIAEHSLGLAEANMRIMREGYRSGVKTLSEVLEAQALLQESKNKRNNSRYTYKQRCYDYERLTN